MLHDRFVRNHAAGRLLTAEASAGALVRRIASPDTGRVWSAGDAS